MKNITTLEPRAGAQSSSAALIRQPATFLPSATATYDEDPVTNNQDAQLLAAAARTASVTLADFTNFNARGLVMVLDVTAVPTVETLTLVIEGKDSASGKYYTILQSTASAATGTVVLRVYPGLTASANLVANDVLPRTWRARVVHSASGSFTYTLGASLVV